MRTYRQTIKIIHQNKNILYNSLLKPVHLYASAKGGTASSRLQIFLNTTLLDAPFYVRHSQIQRDLQIPTMLASINKNAKKFYSGLPNIPNNSIKGLSQYNPEDHTKYILPKRVLQLQEDT